MKILITPRSFAKENDAPLKLLLRHGYDIVRNDTGGILNETQMIERLMGCEGIILGVDPMNERVLKAAIDLKAIAKYGVGLDNVDLATCERRGIRVSRTTGANSTAVADYAFALMLTLARRVISIDHTCRLGDWSKVTTADVTGKRLGLLGFGAVGKEVAARAVGFSMEVLACDVVWDEAAAAKQNIRYADVDTICTECDFISLHLPLLPDTRGIISRERIARMKPDAFLINTARGGLIDETALLEALLNRRIAGAGLDAFEQEPPSNPEWFTLDNVILGSHCAASTSGAIERMGMMAAENLICDLQNA